LCSPKREATDQKSCIPILLLVLIHTRKTGIKRIERNSFKFTHFRTMINGLGVLGWGVGGIEAEAVMLGQVQQYFSY
jgi:hypothetical protein